MATITVLDLNFDVIMSFLQTVCISLRQNWLCARKMSLLSEITPEVSNSTAKQAELTSCHNTLWHMGLYHLTNGGGADSRGGGQTVIRGCFIVPML